MDMGIVTELLSAGLSTGLAINDANNELGQVGGVGAAKQRGLRDVGKYEEAIDRITLLNMALWSIIKEKLGVTDEELLKRVEEIDLSDGRLDGKVRVQIATCPQCDRHMSSKHQRCLYCGYIIPARDPILKVMAGPMLEENEEVKPLQGTWEEATKT